MAANLQKYPPVAITVGIAPQATLWEWATDDLMEDVAAENYLITGAHGLDMTVPAISRQFRPGDFITVQSYATTNPPGRQRFYLLYTADPDTYTLVPCTLGVKDTKTYAYGIFKCGNIAWSGSGSTLQWTAPSGWQAGFELLIGLKSPAANIHSVSAKYNAGTTGIYTITLDNADATNTTTLNYVLVGKGYST